MGVWLPAPRAVCNPSGSERATLERAETPAPHRDEPSSSHELGRESLDAFWHTEVRNERHTLAYTGTHGGVTALSQMLEICNERYLRDHPDRGCRDVSPNHDSVVV
jgi:hypothetical protein